MFHIAACDENKSDIEYLKQFLHGFFKARAKSPFQLNAFDNSKRLLNSVEGNEGVPYDIYFLETNLSGLNGIELGLKLREKGMENPIIYLSRCKDYALESFQVHPEDYLLKPLRSEQLMKSLQRILNKQTSRTEPVFLLKLKDRTHSIPYSEIVYLEYVNHSLLLCTSTDLRLHSISFRESFKSVVEPLLSDTEGRFIQVHASFVINMEHISFLSQNRDFIMATEDKIPISAKKLLAVKATYFSYLNKKTK